MKYVNKEINDPLALAKLRDDAEFMLGVFRFRKLASDFDRVSDRLKDDDNFIQRTKDIFSDNSLEFFSLAISLRNYRKEKEKREAQQNIDKQNKTGKNNVKKKDKGSTTNRVTRSSSAKIEQTSSIMFQDEKSVKDGISPSTKIEKKVPLRVESARKVSNVTKCEKDSNNDLDHKVVESFASLVGKLPISQEERDLVIAMYQDATEENKLVAWMMVYDFVNYNGKKHPVRLLKSPKNNVCRFIKGF